MELTKEKTDKIIQQYLKQREYAKIYYKKYQKDNKDKINEYNIEQYNKNKERILLQKKEYYKRKKAEKKDKKEEDNKKEIIIE
jgi:hypothetical protein